MWEPKCKCWQNGLRPNMTWEQLITEIVRPQKYCTAGHYICPTLDKELRRADAERQRRGMYAKRLKKQGYSDEEIAQRQKQRVKTRVADVVDFNFEIPDETPKRRRVKAS